MAADYRAHDRTMCRCVDFVGREGGNMVVVTAAPICKEEVVASCLVMFRGCWVVLSRGLVEAVDIRC